jgi:serine/threonine protein kinase
MKTTLYGRGTTGYRAPELLGSDSERPRFSNRSDVWALGCILNEIITGQRLFVHDFSTFEYKQTSSELPLRYSFGGGFWEDLFSEWIRGLLSKDPSVRPNAREVCNVLWTYDLLLYLTPSTAMRITNYPEFLKWTRLIGNDVSKPELILGLAHWYWVHDDPSTSQWLVRSLQLRNEIRSNGAFWENSGEGLRRMGVAFFKRGHLIDGILLYQILRDLAPEGVVQLSRNRALEQGDRFSLRALLELGEDVEGLWDQTPLHWVPKYSHEKLLQATANLGESGETMAFDWAKSMNNLGPLACPKLVVFDLSHIL